MKLLSFTMRVSRMDRIRNEDIRGKAMLHIWEVKPERPDRDSLDMYRKCISRKILRLELAVGRSRGRPKRRFMNVVTLGWLEWEKRMQRDRLEWRQGIGCDHHWMEHPNLDLTINWPSCQETDSVVFFFHVDHILKHIKANNPTLKRKKRTAFKNQTNASSRATFIDSIITQWMEKGIPSQWWNSWHLLYCDCVIGGSDSKRWPCDQRCTLEGLSQASGLSEP